MENSYELMLLNKSGLSEGDEKKVFSLIETLIAENGKVIKTSNVGKRQLAYSIKKQTEGNYWVMEFTLASNAVPALTKKLAMEDKILRHLLLRKDPKKTEIPKKTETIKESKTEVKQKMTGEVKKSKGKK